MDTPNRRRRPRGPPERCLEGRPAVRPDDQSAADWGHVPKPCAVRHCSVVEVRDARRTDRLVLRPVGMTDSDVFIAIHVDPRTNSHSPGGPPSTEWAEGFLVSLARAWERGLSYWAVELEGKVVGFAGAEATTVLDRECWNLYYRFAVDVWGRGFATEATREAARVATAVDPRRPLVARTRPGNLAAIRVAERAGLTRHVDLDHDGYAVLVANW